MAEEGEVCKVVVMGGGGRGHTPNTHFLLPSAVGSTPSAGRGGEGEEGEEGLVGELQRLDAAMRMLRFDFKCFLAQRKTLLVQDKLDMVC